jgi:hypothetical protein
MDDDMEAVEIVFAQRLASGEPNIRKRALKLLREHITEQSTKKGLLSSRTHFKWFSIFQDSRGKISPVSAKDCIIHYGCRIK